MSYVSSYFHCVFSTKQRRPLIAPELRDRLWPFLGGIARQNRMKAIDVGGMPDHVHILLSRPANLSIAKALQLGTDLSRPFGTWLSWHPGPNVKTLGYCRLSLRDRIANLYRYGYNCPAREPMAPPVSRQRGYFFVPYSFESTGHR